MGKHEEPAQPRKPLDENGDVGFGMAKGVIWLVVSLVVVIAAVIAVVVGCSPTGDGGGADLPGGY